ESDDKRELIIDEDISENIDSLIGNETKSKIPIEHKICDFGNMTDFFITEEESSAFMAKSGKRKLDITSIAGVWKELFQLSSDFSDKENILRGSIAYGVQKMLETSVACTWYCNSEFMSEYFAVPSNISDKDGTIKILKEKILFECFQDSIENSWKLTSPLIIFAAYETWDWTKEHLVDQYILPNLQQFSCQNISEQAFNLFSNLYAVDESPDRTSVSQLLVFVHETDKKFCVMEELLGMFPIKGQTTGSELLPSLIHLCDAASLNMNNCISITTDGAKSMIGTKMGMVMLLKERFAHCGVELLQLHALFIKRICGKELGFATLMQCVSEAINFICCNALKHGNLKNF
ncbi:uncharacterized protein TNCV_11, partial [Trichonephila clavipes]